MALVFGFLIFISIIIAFLIGYGFYSNNPALGISLVTLGFFAMILTGALLFSEGVRDEASPTFEKTGDTVALTGFATLTTSSDSIVAMLAHFYFYGSFAVLAVMGYLVFKLGKEKREAWY